MCRHYRNDHGNKQTEIIKTDIFACLIKDCLKEYKTQGWLTRHIKTYCPQNVDEFKKEKTKRKLKYNLGVSNNPNDQFYKCSYEKCTKRLPTWKGIVNHLMWFIRGL